MKESNSKPVVEPDFVPEANEKRGTKRVKKPWTLQRILTAPIRWFLRTIYFSVGFLLGLAIGVAGTLYGVSNMVSPTPPVDVNGPIETPQIDTPAKVEADPLTEEHQGATLILPDEDSADYGLLAFNDLTWEDVSTQSTILIGGTPIANINRCQVGFAPNPTFDRVERDILDGMIVLSIYPTADSAPTVLRLTGCEDVEQPAWN